MDVYNSRGAVVRGTRTANLALIWLRWKSVTMDMWVYVSSLVKWNVPLAGVYFLEE